MRYSDIALIIKNSASLFLAGVVLACIISAAIFGVAYKRRRDRIKEKAAIAAKLQLDKDREEGERKAQVLGTLAAQLAERNEDNAKLAHEIADIRKQNLELAKNLDLEKEKRNKWQFWGSVITAIVAVIGSIGTFLGTNTGNTVITHVFSGTRVAELTRLHNEDVKQHQLDIDNIAARDKTIISLTAEKKQNTSQSEIDNDALKKCHAQLEVLKKCPKKPGR